MLAALREATGAIETPSERKAKLAVLAKMVLAYPIAASTSADSSRARADAYMDALEDVPLWAIAEAVRRWNRGECGTGNRYDFAPAPAILRGVCKAILEPLRIAAADIEAVLTAKASIDEAMGRDSNAGPKPPLNYEPPDDLGWHPAFRPGPGPSGPMPKPITATGITDELAARMAAKQPTQQAAE